VYNIERKTMLSFKLENFVDTRSLDKLADLYELITDKRLRVKDTGINYRVINHWDNKGLIRFGRNSKEGDRKFSFADFIWIKVVNELRSFGVQLPIIKKLADDVYAPIPMMELMDSLAKNTNTLSNYKGDDKDLFMAFLKSGDYRKIPKDEMAPQFNYLQILVIEAIAARNLVSLIVFDDGEWFPYIKSHEHNYPEELLNKKESRSQVRISLSETVYRYIVLDTFQQYTDIFGLFNTMEGRLLTHIKEGDFKNISVKFKSKKREPVEIKKNKTTLITITEIIREGEYKEIILIDKKGAEFKIRENTPKEEALQLKEREKAFAEFAPIIREHKAKYGKSKKLKIVK
jgi:hypothetical protein